MKHYDTLDRDDAYYGAYHASEAANRATEVIGDGRAEEAGLAAVTVANAAGDAACAATDFSNTHAAYSAFAAFVAWLRARRDVRRQ